MRGPSADAWSGFWFDPPLKKSPITGARRDTRVFPRFWVNGLIYGQNTIPHDGTTRSPMLKGRKTLVSVHVVASDDDLQGVRVYAEWNGQIVESNDRTLFTPLHRDRARHTDAAPSAPAGRPSTCCFPAYRTPRC